MKVTIELHTVEEVHRWGSLLARMTETAPATPQETSLAEKLENVMASVPAVCIAEAADVHVSDFGELPIPYQGEKITDAELEAAITVYYKAEGLPAAKALLAKYGVERVGEIPAERRREATMEMADHGA